MLKIMNIDPNYGGSLIEFTADNYFITADTLDYTADQTIVSGGAYRLNVPFRFFSDRVKFYMIDTLTNKHFLDEVDAINYNNGTLMIRVDYNFKSGDNFESTIRDMNDNLIWRGRIFSTDQTDLQNFKVNVPNENGVIKI